MAAYKFPLLGITTLWHKLCILAAVLAGSRVDFVCVTAAPAPLLRRPLGAEVPAGSGGPGQPCHAAVNQLLMLLG